MKKSFLLLFIFVLFFLPNKSYTQWISCNGPGAGQVKAMILSGSNIFAAMGNYNGVFLSTNNGASWTPVNNGLDIVRGTTNQTISSLGVIGSNIFAGTSNKGVYMSADYGSSWTAVNSGMTTANVQALAVIGTNLFAGTSSAGAFISTDNGTSWNTINSGLGAANVKVLTVSGANLYAGLSGVGVNYSTDNGTSWKNLNGFLTSSKTITALAANGVNLFAATSAGCFRSAINDTAWTNISSGLANVNSSAVAINGSDLFAGTFSGISHSTNNGTNWTTVNTGIWPTVQQVNCFLFNGSTIFAGSNAQGIFASANNGTNWSLSSTGLTNCEVKVLYSSGSNLFAGTTYNGVFRSTDNGVTWIPISLLTGPINSSTIYGLTSVGGYLICGTNGTKICYRSSDNGDSWAIDSVGLFADACRALCTDGTNLYYGFFSHGVYKSTDNGATWAVSSSGITNLNVRGLFYDGTNVYCGTTGGVFVSTDQGATWTARNTGLTLGQAFFTFARLGPWLFTGTPGASSYRSSNNGVTWTTMPTLPAALNSILTYGSTLYAGTSGSGSFFQSSDSGATWTANYGGVVSTNNIVQCLAVCNSNLFLGLLDNGAWKLPLVTVSTLTATALIQGFYNGTTMVSDTVTVQLHNSTSPYALVEAQKSVLNTSGTGTFSFTTAANGTPYYIAIKHRNAVETWSATTPSFTSNALTYDFTTAQSQAYGSNMFLKGSKWCLYNGDVTHDGLVDGDDLSAVDNDNINFVTGYTNTDVTGDNLVDGDDLSLVDNNNNSFIGKVVPSGTPSAVKVIRSEKGKINHQQ